ncbi:GNAT family N-acetyltransferase [Mongoliitalea daihaiensis]|uniref:GNAT family N-acetyltransferase n=1 Tax=Mongoliitalea daihaiensis TaxID=2782006 RepID=UPI001F3F9FA3|nr:GNAT family N-acetyltransferase [Mongoliitalea daihaiensis]UJP64869.1 GNAT family N-acetyltransferase [Mongoliitalea daihaiensis]
MKNEYPQSSKSIYFKLFTEKEFLTLKSKTALVEAWKELIHLDSGASIFQHPSFILDWYEVYAAKFSPVILFGFSEDKLMGVLSLANPLASKERNHLVGAGSVFALYQTWVVKEGFLRVFWEEGIVKLLLEKGYSVNLKSLPGEQSYQELANLASFQKYTVLESHNNPVLDLQSEGIKEVLGKRHFKAKFNRFQRAGNTQFIRLEQQNEFDQSISDIQVFLNLRQGAAFNKFPLAKDPEQEEIFAKWFRSGVLQATILQLDGELIASVMVIDDFGKTSHLAGLITYSPVHAKLSPGLVHVYMLAYYLQEHGYQDLKLSPGDDAYKERFSNRREVMQEVLLSKNPLELAKRKARIRFRNYLKTKGIRPMAFQVDISKKKADFKTQSWNIFKPIKTHSWEFLVQFIQANASNCFFKQSPEKLKNLLFVTDTCLEISRWRFLEDALERLENQEQCLTMVKDDKVLLCIWYHGTIETLHDLEQLKQDKKISKIYTSRNLK